MLKKNIMSNQCSNSTYTFINCIIWNIPGKLRFRRSQHRDRCYMTRQFVTHKRLGEGSLQWAEDFSCYKIKVWTSNPATDISISSTVLRTCSVLNLLQKCRSSNSLVVFFQIQIAFLRAVADVGPRAEACVATLCIFNCCFQARTSSEGSVTDWCWHQSGGDSNIICHRWSDNTAFTVARFLWQLCCLCYIFEYFGPSPINDGKGGRAE